MEIPFTHLSADALQGIIEEFVSREGTEYGAREFSLAEKVEAVVRQLQNGDVYVDYDPAEQTCNLRHRGEAPSPS
ncbi:MAG: hypothetical protein RLZZ385_2044 [Pseudomonadota bacterium]|jgi:uncharacterized protein YheU (UPF0270 family)